ncbi:hypothetical protein [Sodalis endosymbiont of Henestaris halophilus]
MSSLEGRLTKRQQHAIDKFWLVLGIYYQAHELDLNAQFDSVAPVTLEIGFVA